MKVVILTRQIGHYHDARFAGAVKHVPDLTVLSIANEGNFKQFDVEPDRSYTVVRLYDNQAAYEQNVSEGRVQGDMKVQLDALAPDVLVVSGWAGAESFAALLWARAAGCPVVFMSESQIFDAPRQALREAIKRRIVSHGDAGFVGGQTHADYLAALGLPREAIFMGYNAVGNETYVRSSEAARLRADHWRNELSLPESYILASARFIPKKNLVCLVQAYAATTSELAPDLVILGDGELRPEIEAVIAQEGMGARVHLAGFHGPDALPAFYGLASGFVHVSLTEQWGLVVNEAMASGLPVIVSKMCGVANIMQDTPGCRLITPTDKASIETALSELFAMSETARQDAGARNRDLIGDWGPDRFGLGLKQAVEAAKARHRKRWLAPWDQFLLARMTRKTFSDVS